MDADAEELQDEPVPSVITNEYLKIVLAQTDDFVKELRGQGNYQLANQVIKLVTISENLQFQVKDEQKKIQDLLEKFVDADGRIEAALKISNRDRDVIEELRKEVSKAWSMADAALMREQNVHESFNQARQKLLVLQEQNKKIATKFEDSDELGEDATTVLQECDRLATELVEANKRLLVQRSYSEEIQKKLEDQMEKNRELFREWDMATNESLGNRKNVEVLTVKNAELRDQLETTEDNLMMLKEQNEKCQRRLKEREKIITEIQEFREKISNENAMLTANKAKLELAMRNAKNYVSNAKQELAQLQNYVRLKDDENRKLLLENEQSLKKVESLQRKITTLEKTVSKNELDIVNKKTEIATTEKERDMMKKSSDDLKKENDKLKKKIEHLNTDQEKLNASLQELKQERQTLFDEKSKLSAELKISIERDKKASANIKKLQANLEMVESEKLYLNEIIKQLNEDAEAKKKYLDKMKQELSEAKDQVAKYKHEYNSILKTLKDTRSDLQRCGEREMDVKDRLMKSQAQVEDINLKFSIKLEEMATLAKKYQRLEKSYRETKRDWERCQDTLRITRGELKQANHDSKLQKEELRENDARFMKMKGQMDKILRERDLIANQMFRKGDENELLEQEVSTLKMSLDRGDSMYNQRLEDIRIMKNEIKNLRSQSNVLKRAIENTFDLRHETLQLHRKLNQERTKAKVLEEELLTPMNVHRWRKLGWRDPDRMSLLRKYQRFQRTSFRQMLKLSKAQETVKELQEKNSNLQKELDRISNFNIQGKLVSCKSQLNLNTKRMKAAIALSRASESDVTAKDCVIDQLQKDLNAIKSQLFKEKRGKMRLMEKLQEANKDNADTKCGKKLVELKNLGDKFKIGIMN